MKQLTSDFWFKRSICPIANVLDIVGDKWSLLIVRDIYLGKRTYGEFLQSPEQISTNILANRLKQLEESGLITKVAYQKTPTRYQYELSEKGSDLLPVLKVMLVWADKHLPDSQVLPKVER